MNATSPSRPLELYTPAGMWGLPCISPFGTKLETWLRMTGIPHRVIIEDDPRKGPKRKMPWIVDSGTAIGDSALIIEHLKRTRGVDPDAHLSARDQAVSLMLRRTFEEHFHQIFEYALFASDVGWEQVRPHFDFLPALPRPLILKFIRADSIKSGYIRGIGRHTPAEIARMAEADLSAAGTWLGDSQYFFGDRPTTTDCTLFGFLSMALWAPIECPGQETLRQQANLVRFCERMIERYWPQCTGLAKLGEVAERAASRQPERAGYSDSALRA